MKKIILFATISFLFIAGSLGCKNNLSDPFKVANLYLSALEKGNLKQAYELLSDRSLIVKTQEGKIFKFQPKPSFGIYKRSMSGISKFKIVSIQHKPEISAEGKLEIYEIKASIKRVNEQNAIIEMFMIYLSPDSEGQWFVLIPAIETNSSGESSASSSSESATDTFLSK